MKAYIWRDKHDKNMYSLGGIYRHGHIEAWRGHIDPMSDMLGRDFADALRDLDPGGDPVEIEITVELL